MRRVGRLRIFLGQGCQQQTALPQHREEPVRPNCTPALASAPLSTTRNFRPPSRGCTCRWARTNSVISAPHPRLAPAAPAAAHSNSLKLIPNWTSKPRFDTQPLPLASQPYNSCPASQPLFFKPRHIRYPRPLARKVRASRRSKASSTCKLPTVCSSNRTRALSFLV